MSKYPQELRQYVFEAYGKGRKARDIFTDVMRKWPDCGMISPQSIAMMIGANKQRLRSGSYRPPRQDAAAPAISLAGPSWSRQS